MFMDWLRKAPTVVTVTVIITCGLLVAVLVAAFVFLSIEGVDTTEFRQWVNTIGQLLLFPLVGTGVVASWSAARSSDSTEKQTNGQLSARDQTIAEQGAEIARLRKLLGGR